MSLTAYRLPDQRIVPILEDVARGAATVTFQLAGGAVVEAVRVGPPPRPAPAPVWCQTLAASLVSIAQDVAADGGDARHLRDAFADFLEQELAR